MVAKLVARDAHGNFLGRGGLVIYGHEDVIAGAERAREGDLVTARHWTAIAQRYILDRIGHFAAEFDTGICDRDAHNFANRAEVVEGQSTKAVHGPAIIDHGSSREHFVTAIGREGKTLRGYENGCEKRYDQGDFFHNMYPFL